MVQDVPRGPAILVCLSLGASLGQGPFSAKGRTVPDPPGWSVSLEGSLALQNESPGCLPGPLLACPPPRTVSPCPVRLPVVRPEFSAASPGLTVGQRLETESGHGTGLVPRAAPLHPLSGSWPQARTVLSPSGAFMQVSEHRFVRLLQALLMVRGSERRQPDAAGTVSVSRILRL